MYLIVWVKQKFYFIVQIILLVVFSAMLFSFHAQAQPIVTPEEQSQKYLTEMATCYACHTSNNTEPFAGGREFITPLGTIHSTNITPDAETGIGSWTDEEFYRVLHEGIGKNGEQIYPVMPYDAYTDIPYEDAMRIKARLMTQTPVTQENKENELRFPYDRRQLVRGWKFLNFYKGERHSLANNEISEKQRGAYIGETLTRCGSCHTPRTITMGSDPGRALTGALILDNWYAPNITSDRIRGIGKWTDEEIKLFLHTGEISGKAYAIGPMKEIIATSSSHLKEEDLNSLVLWLRNTPFDERNASNNTLSRSEWGRRHDFSALLQLTVKEDGKGSQGQRTQTPALNYYTMCSGCHDIDGSGDTANHIPNLARNTTLGMLAPHNTVKIILDGSDHRTHITPKTMPAFKDHLDDEQIASLTNWVFHYYGRNTTQTDATQVHYARMKLPIGDAPIIALLKASSIALIAFAFIFILGWIVRFSPRVKAIVISLKRKYKSA